MLDSPAEVLVWTQRIVSAGVVLTSAEWLAKPRLLDDVGYMSWEVSRLRHPVFTVGPVARLLDPLFRYPNVLCVHAVRLLLGVLGLIVVNGPWQVAVMTALTLLSILLLARQAFGFDGADQATNLALAAVTLTLWFPGPIAAAAALWFLAGQLCLSYCAAGVAKATNPEWLDGGALCGMLDTHMYGTPALAKLLRPHAGALRMLGSGVVVWECAFPLVLLLPAEALPFFVVTGLTFHAVNALVMGLNSFLISFAALYPPLIWVVIHSRPTGA